MISPLRERLSCSHLAATFLATPFLVATLMASATTAPAQDQPATPPATSAPAAAAPAPTAPESPATPAPPATPETPVAPDAGAPDAGAPDAGAPDDGSGDLQAAPSDDEEPVTQVPLTGDVVKRFVESWPDLQKLGDELAEKLGVSEEATDPTTAFAAWSKDPEAKGRIDAVLSAHGFASLQEWIDIANSVMVAYAYDPEELTQARLDETIADIEKNPDIPDDQRAEIIASVKEQFAAAQAMQPLPGNAEAVKPYTDQIGAMMGETVDGAPEEGGVPEVAPGDAIPGEDETPDAQ